jgi:hypothetical protein
MVASLPAHRPSARRKNACSIFAAGPKEVKSRRRRLFVVFLSSDLHAYLCCRFLIRGYQCCLVLIDSVIFSRLFLPLARDASAAFAFSLHGSRITA